MAKKKPNGLFFELDGTISIVERKKGKILSKEPIDGKLVLELLVMVLEEYLDHRQEHKRGE